MQISASRMKEADHKVFVGGNLRLAREALGKSPSQLTKEYGLRNQSKLHNWETGVNYPNLWFLIKLCDDYGFTLDWFLRRRRVGVSAELAENLKRAEAGMLAASPETESQVP